MSFTGEVKRELCQIRLRTLNLRQAEGYGMFAFAKDYSPDRVGLNTENAEVAERYAYHLRAFTPRGAAIRQSKKTVRGRVLHQVSLSAEKDRRALINRMLRLDEGFAQTLCAQEDFSAFLAGVFLVCGNITDPEKRYHLEFAVREQPPAEGLSAALERFLPGSAMTTRRGQSIVYYKDRTQIQDLLALMGAGRASLAVIEAEMIKDVRNHAMRVTNCETANIDKTIRAAGAQIEDIQLLLSEKGLLALPEELREVALARLENPDMSLRELPGCLESPLSYSAVYRRLDKLSKMAAELRKGG
ncbi:MAG: DNA-binding protein WhiA [Oscillospiraceae bacterium]|nr:DNA-binding protein WhiA [Oscillospiraceae bacterium]